MAGQDIEGEEFCLPSVGNALNGQEENDRLLDSAKNRFEQLLKSSKLVSPTTKLKNDEHVYAASDLMICSCDGDLSCCTCHFHQYGEPLPEPFQEGVMANLNKALAQVEKEHIPIVAHFMMCKATVVQKLSRCNYKIRNEAELRYTTGDPLMEMLCDIFSLQVKLEESVINQHRSSSTEVYEGIPRSVAVRKSISTGSHPDYVCYTLRAKDKIVAVIIETKMSSHSSYKHSIAQVIGYYIAFVSGETSSPLVFVLSDKSMQLVMFPFMKDNEKLVNAVRMPSLDLWHNNSPSSFSDDVMGILVMMLMLCTRDDLMSAIPYTLGDFVKKSAIATVKTTCDLLEEMTRRADEEAKRADKEAKRADEEAKRADEAVKRANHLAEEIKRLKYESQ